MPSLGHFTNARVDLGRVGDSVPTAALLEFRQAQAKARDAVHLPLDSHSLAHAFAASGWESQLVTSRAKNRQEYLLRPDFGRCLSDASQERLSKSGLKVPILFCVADGLSAAAVHHHTAGLLRELQPEGPIIVAEQARVAIGDEIGMLLQAELCILLIGERPGLSSPDSLGVYITYAPRPGRTDAERNCVSNIHDLGLSYETAARKIAFLTQESLTRKLTGVGLKERAGLIAG